MSKSFPETAHAGVSAERRGAKAPCGGPSPGFSRTRLGPWARSLGAGGQTGSAELLGVVPCHPSPLPAARPVRVRCSHVAAPGAAWALTRACAGAEADPWVGSVPQGRVRPLRLWMTPARGGLSGAPLVWNRVWWHLWWDCPHVQGRRLSKFIPVTGRWALWPGKGQEGRDSGGTAGKVGTGTPTSRWVRPGRGAGSRRQWFPQRARCGPFADALGGVAVRCPCSAGTQTRGRWPRVLVGSCV